MLTLTLTNAEKDHLEWLIKHMSANPQQLNGTEAWAVFSSKNQTVTLSRRSGKKFKVSPVQRASFKTIKDAVVEKLLTRCGRACAYCRRPVGKYGYGWHIEHVTAKGADWRGTFDLGNLVVGCVDCNFWKNLNVDQKPAAQKPTIINPAIQTFSYATHLRFVQLTTESLAFAKYLIGADPGRSTYDALKLELIERCTAINRMDDKAAELHERLTRVLTDAIDDAEQAELVGLMASLREHIYKAS